MTRRLRATLASAALTSLLATAACSGDEPADSGDEPTVTAELLPAIAQAGPEPAEADDASAVVAARVSPAEEGVTLTLEQESGSGWEEVGSAETTAGGSADFAVEAGPGASYRVTAGDGNPEPVQAPAWGDVFTDEFAGDELDTSTWFPRGEEYNPDGLRACSKGSLDAVDVGGGVLNLRSQLDPARRGETCEAKAADGESLGDYAYRLNGHIANVNLFQYGVTAARIKFQRERGQHGSFWFQSTTNGAFHDDPASGGAEIDVVEYFGDSSDDRLASFIYYPTPDGMVKEGDWIEEASRFLADQDDDWWKRFHVFALEWTEDEYVVRIDGQEAWRTDQGVSQQPESMVLSLLSSDYELPKLKDEGKLPQTMQVDWVYGMDVSGSTPIRVALHAIGKMYANQSPYVAAAGSEVVQYPCQQNFTFVTTDGYWNGNAAANVVSNDNVENANRFCLKGTGCVDKSVQSDNSLADIALYWYNGGSNTTVTSLRPDLEDWTKPTGQVAVAAGDNTRLHMNTYTLGLGVDGLLNYEPNYDKAPVTGGDFYKLITGVTTGCPWNNNGAYVWPDPKTGDNSGGAAYQSRVDDLWHAAINGHGKYFSASDPKQVVDGLRSALNNIEVKIGAAAAAATSTPNISKDDNDIFSDTFTTVRWYGELSKKKIDTVTGVVNSTPVWNTSNTLGTKVAADTDTRKIRMRSKDGGLIDFNPDNLTASDYPLERGWFANKCSALTQCSSLSASDRAIVNDPATIINWLRGQQQYANDTLLRAYSRTAAAPAGPATPIPIVLGDIASRSKPAFMREPRKGYTLDGYDVFKSTWALRTPTVFAAANDGMLHSFDAGTGTKNWAYMPRITMSKLHLQASTTYGSSHQFTTDGSPELGDVQIGGKWATVLVAGLNAGGRGYYALDVSDPANPVSLWEICADSSICSGDSYYPNMGLTFGNPQFGTWKKDAASDAQWVVFLTSGYNNAPGVDSAASKAGEGILFVVDIATGKVLDTLSTRSATPPRRPAWPKLPRSPPIRTPIRW